VTVSSASPADPDTTNNSASATTTIVWSANLQLQQIGNLGQFAPTYIVDVPIDFQNYGPSPASDFRLTFTIPPGLSFSSVSNDLEGETMSCTAPSAGQSGDVVCTMPSLSSQEGNVTEYVSVLIPAATAPGTVFTFNATLTSSDALKSPQTATGSLQVVAANDLSVTMTSPASVAAGASYDNAVTVTNNGPGTPASAGVVVKFTGGITPQTPTGPVGWTCQASTQSASCSTSSPFPPGTATFTFPGFAPANVPAGAKTQTANTNAFNDVNASNNTSTTTTTVQTTAQTDVSVSISGNPTVVHTGDMQTYTVQITNTGSSAALDVALNAQFPGTALTNSCGPATLTTCSFASLNPGASVSGSFAVRITAATPGTLTASATVTARNLTGQKTALTTTTDAGEPHVDVQPVLTPPPAIYAGAFADWTIGIVNHGPDAVHGWTLSFTIPAGVSIQAVESIDTTVSCHVNSATTIQCSGTDLGKDGFGAHVIGQVTAASGQLLHATLTASTANHDLHPENDVATIDSSVTPPGPDLALALKVSASATTPGGTENLTIDLSNLGNATADQAQVIVPLLPLFVLQSSDPHCSGLTTLTCNFFSVIAGGKSSFTVTLRAAGLGNETLTGTATTSTPEPRTDNNTASVSVEVIDAISRRRAARH